MLTTASAFSIRHATEQDAEFFFQMELQTTWENLPRSCGTSWKYGAVREALCATHHVLLQMPGNVFYVAEVEGHRAGLLWFGTKRNHISGQEEGWVYNVTVREGFRGNGIAKALLARAEDHATEQGYGIIGLSVAVHNEIARGLYEAMGYSESNIILRKPLALQASVPVTNCVLCREGDD